MARQGLTLLMDSAPRARLTPELVALCEREEPRQGPEPGLAYFTDEDYQAAAMRLMGEAAGRPVWIFAYGSLLWRECTTPSTRRVLVGGSLLGTLSLS